VLSTLLVLALLGGTAAAFAVTESLKLQKSPIYATRVTKIFSPVCRCESDRAQIAFRLRQRDHVTVAIENAAGRTVRLIVDNRRTPSGFHSYPWDGRLASGRLAPDGTYRPRLELDDADRSIVLPNRITLDTVRPRIVPLGARVGPLLVSVRYRVSEHARGVLLVGGRQVVKTYRAPLEGSISVSRGLLRRRGLAGVVAVAAVDGAGNRSATKRLTERVPREAG
jgi:hypothetical protein